MRQANRKRCAAILFLLLLIGQAAYAQAGSSGFSVLKLGVSARGVALADAMNAHARGVDAAFYNPAALSLPLTGGSTAQLTVTHKEWIQDTRTEFLGALLQLSDRDAIGFSMNSTSISDIEIRTQPGEAEGTFTARDYWLGVSYGRRLSDDLRLGVTAKFLYEKILVDEASGIAFDIGAHYATPLEHLSVGAAVDNLGSMNSLRNESTKLPALLRVGPAYSSQLEGTMAAVTLASDFVHLFSDSKSYLNLGGEFVFDNSFAARMGYRFGSEGQKLSAGVGVTYEFLMMDYAYAPLTNDLGTGHTISLSFNL